MLQVLAVRKDFVADCFPGDSVKCIAIFLPFLRSANDTRALQLLFRLQLLGPRLVLLRLRLMNLMSNLRGLRGRMLFQFALRIESAGKHIRSCDDG